MFLVVTKRHSSAGLLPRVLRSVSIFGLRGSTLRPIWRFCSLGDILGRSIIQLASIASAMIARWSPHSLCFGKVSNLISADTRDLIIRETLDLLIEVGHFLGAVEDWLAHSTISVGINRNFQLMATHVTHSVQRLITSDWCLWNWLATKVVVLMGYIGKLTLWVFDLQIWPFAILILSWRGRLVVSFITFGPLMLIASLIALLRLSTGKVLTQGIVTVSAFKPFEQILAIHVLDDWPLDDAGQTLENATACTASIFVDVDHCVTLADVAALDASSLLSTRLFAWNVTSCLAKIISSCAIVCLCRLRAALACNLIEIGLLLRHHVQVADQVRNFSSLIGGGTVSTDWDALLSGLLTWTLR